MLMFSLGSCLMVVMEGEELGIPEPAKVCTGSDAWELNVITYYNFK